MPRVDIEPRPAGGERARRVCGDLGTRGSLRQALFPSDSGAQKARHPGGKVAFCALSPTITEVFQLSGFDSLFALHPDRSAAVAALQ